MKSFKQFIGEMSTIAQKRQQIAQQENKRRAERVIAQKDKVQKAQQQRQDTDNRAADREQIKKEIKKELGVDD